MEWEEVAASSEFAKILTYISTNLNMEDVKYFSKAQFPNEIMKIVDYQS